MVPTTENWSVRIGPSRGMYVVGGGGMGGGYGQRMEFFSSSPAEGMHIFIVSSCNKTRSQDELSP